MAIGPEIVYALSMLTSLLCAAMLFRAYQRGGSRLLFWSALCFAFLCLNNVLLFADLIVFARVVDLSTWRLLPALAGIAVLCYGLIEEES